jgi:ankyrin repeat protein
VAAQEGHVDALAALIDCGCDINARKRDGTTALYVSAQQGNSDRVLRSLIRCYAKPARGWGIY